ncbi:MAG: hypothetical protein DRH26_04730, partial [Deltaproteobacteria bacterium]
YFNDPDLNGDGIGVDINLATGEAIDGWGNTDTLTHIQAVSGSDYRDTLLGSDSNEGFLGTLGNDSIDGSGGWDWVSYAWLNNEEGFKGVNIDLGGNIATGLDSEAIPLFTDTLFNIEEVEGSRFSDAIQGNAADNWLSGWEGDDHIIGGEGYDTLVGGQGDDIIEGALFDGNSPQNNANYQDDPGGITAQIYYDSSDSYNSFDGSNVIDGWEDIDILINIARIKGSNYDDQITINIDDLFDTDDTSWHIWGNGGSDTITGTAGEMVSAMYFDDPSGVNIDLSTGIAHDGWGGTDTLTDIYAVSGSDYGDDSLIGSSGDNGFYGSFGDDLINGGDGYDWIDYGWLDGDENFSYIKLDFDPTEDYMTVTAYDSEESVLFSDTLYNIESFQGTSGEDIFAGNNEDNWFSGEAGADLLKGNGGNDVFNFTDSSSIDSVLDFTTGEENDVLRFDESNGLNFHAQGGYDIYTSAMNSDPVDPTAYKIVGVTVTVSDWLNVASVINGAVDAGSGDGTDDGTYFVVSNGEEGRVYYWEGDTNPNNDSIDNTVDEYELTHFVNLDQFGNDDILSLSDVNFQIDFHPGAV